MIGSARAIQRPISNERSDSMVGGGKEAGAARIPLMSAVGRLSISSAAHREGVAFRRNLQHTETATPGRMGGWHTQCVEL